MQPFIVLYFIPIGLIAIVIIAIIRLIIRASSGGNSNPTNTNYRQPPQPGQYNNPPMQNPYQTNQQQQNPYVNTPPPVYPPSDPSQVPPVPNQQTPPAWQNPGTYQPPTYQQPNYNQPNYAPSTYNEPGVTPGTTKRNTPIGTDYSTYTGAPPAKKSNTTMIVVLSIIGVVVILAGTITYVAYQRANGAGSLVSEDFRLAYDNPTENTYYIVLDDWDTIKVEPFTSSDDLDYTHRRDLTDFHWQMFTEDFQTIADTTVSKYDVETWINDRTSMSWNYSTILFNPSRTQYVYYTAWFDEIGLEYMDDVKVGDSTFFCDAYTVNDAFIFDGREAEFQIDLEDATETSDLDQNQYLVNQYDFAVLYAKLNFEEPQEAAMEDFRNELLDMFTYGKEEVMVNSAYDSDDVLTYYSLDSLTPGEVDEYSEPRDFIPAIEFVEEHASLFRATARSQYDYIVDHADSLLKHSYVEQERPADYMKMTRKSYVVYEEGMLADEPRREVSYEVERNTFDASMY